MAPITLMPRATYHNGNNTSETKLYLRSLVINHLKKITNKMATSLMNDTALMKNITKGMLKVAEMIFIHHHSNEKLDEITNI